MTYRKLRIAWSVMWGIACALLIVLWVRSYWCWDNLDFGSSHRIDSLRGHLTIDDEIAFSIPDWIANQSGPLFGSSLEWTTFSIRGAAAQGVGTAIPDWLMVFVVATLAAVPWMRQLRFRFSLRTLLIATTLLAVGLGLIMWLR